MNSSEEKAVDDFLERTTVAKYIRARDAAAMLGVSDGTIYALLKEGQVKGIRVRGSIRVEYLSVLEYEDANRIVAGEMVIPPTSGSRTGKRGRGRPAAGPGGRADDGAENDDPPIATFIGRMPK